MVTILKLNSKKTSGTLSGSIEEEISEENHVDEIMVKKYDSSGNPREYKFFANGINSGSMKKY